MDIRRSLAAVLGLLLTLTSLVAPGTAFAAAKPVKTNFTKMSDLLGTLKAKGITCSPYSKTPAELVIEEGKCQFQGVEILIDLWPKAKTAKDFSGSMKKMAAYYIETEFWPAGSKMFIFYTNNYILSIDGVMPDTSKAEKVAKIIEKKLGIKYVIGN